MNPPTTIACLGPEGSFSHLITQMRFPNVAMNLRESVSDVFDYLATNPDALGIVPIENSSGGFIIDTVDRLVDPRSPLHIQEELVLDVKLALLGRTGEEITSVHSHAIPFYHCDEWLRANYPLAQRVKQASTTKAAEIAAQTPGAAAIGSRKNAERHALQVLHFPIAGEVPNITQFYLIGHAQNIPALEHNRTSLAVELPDRPGSLCRFLTPLSENDINLKRLESRPIRGQPNKYRFYIQIEGSTADPRVQRALDQARADGATIRSIGTYSAGSRFES